MVDPACCVDQLVDITRAEVELLLDYLAAECDIRLPLAVPTNRLAGYHAVATLNPHEAKVLRTRLQKKLRGVTLHQVCNAYGRASEGGTEWYEFLCRQSTCVTSDDCQLVLALPV
ncbi:hypothetical protein Pan181_40540 [Aeoliella mucimassa]|uniref:Uncharacterized protein n=2 Tax=Aeoliella mucimassa TaxID=2527972 RepID=A0A518ASX1_9BACT|nr:hypothetical protein Pan181_40540 [Aeoliella mucimassa]